MGLKGATAEQMLEVIESGNGRTPASVGYDFYLHEALHTVHVLICTWGEHVLESKAVTDDPELTKLAEEASTAMAKVYQAIGAKY